MHYQKEDNPDTTATGHTSLSSKTFLSSNSAKTLSGIARESLALDADRDLDGIAISAPL